MELIYTENKIENGVIQDCDFDCEVGEKNDFALIISENIDRYLNIVGEYVYLEDTEFGGIVLSREIKDHKLTLKGKSFRGMLADKVILPQQNQDYYIISGGLRDSLTELFRNCFAEEFELGEVPHLAINFQFDRYTTLLKGLTKLFEKYKMRMNLHRKNNKIMVDIFFKEEIEEEKELSEECGIKIELKQMREYPDVIVALGKGELQEREVKYLGLNKSTFEIKEITPDSTWNNKRIYVYENTSSDDLIKDATGKFQELIGDANNQQGFKNEIQVNVSDIDLEIGTVLQAFEQYTKTRILVEVIEKIYKKKGVAEGIISYKVKGVNYGS